jgi:hypothetical protein
VALATKYLNISQGKKGEGQLFTEVTLGMAKYNKTACVENPNTNSTGLVNPDSDSDFEVIHVF